MQKYLTTDTNDLSGDMSERLTSLVSRKYLVEMIAINSIDRGRYHIGKIATMTEFHYEVPEAFDHVYESRGDLIPPGQLVYKLPDETACREFLAHVNTLWFFEPSV